MTRLPLYDIIDTQQQLNIKVIMARTKEEIQEYHNRWRREARRKRGLQKQGRKELSEEDKLKAIERKKEYIKQYNKDNPWKTRPLIKRILWSAKKRAKIKNVPFNLTEEDIIIPEFCPYLGIKITEHSDRYDKRGSVASLDRIIPELGYVKGNVEVISHQANTMKSNATKEQLLLFAKIIMERYSES